MEGSRYRYWPDVVPLPQSGKFTSTAAREIQQKEAQRGLRAASDPYTLRCAIVEAQTFHELTADITTAEAQLSELERRMEDRVRLAISNRELGAVTDLLCEVDGWQAGGGPAVGWLARLNEAAASILDELEADPPT